MHNQNEAFLHLNDALPADIARRRDMGDLAGALRLIDARLSSGVQPLLAPRLEAERLRLTRLPYDYPYTRPEAVALVRAEWPGFTEAQFDALLDGGRIDWRMVDGELRVHREFLESLRIYPKEAPGLVHEAVDNAERRDIPGSVAFVPSVAGLILAGEVIKDLSGVRERRQLQ